MRELELQFFPVCYRDDTFSYIVSFFQLAPQVLTFSLTGIGMYRRDFTMIFMVWVTWFVCFGVAYGLAQYAKINRPSIYTCSDTYAFPDYTFTATVGLLVNFIFIAITSRIRIYFSTVLWLCLGILLYSFAVVWNYQLFGYQMIMSFSLAVSLGCFIGCIYTIFFHPLKFSLAKCWLGKILGLQESFD